jgi:hypothetical protein
VVRAAGGARLETDPYPRTVPIKTSGASRQSIRPVSIGLG